MALSAIEVKGAKPKNKPYKLSDGGGLFMLVQPNGAKYWRMDYSFAGKRKTLAIGVYPDVSLSDARVRRDAARQQLANDIDPSAEKQTKKAAVMALTKNSFEIVGREWLSKFSKDWKESHTRTVRGRLENDVFPWLGVRPIGEINAPELLTVLRRIESRGALSTAHTVSAICGQVFRYAIATGRAQRDPSADLKGAIPPYRIRHLAALTDPVKIGKLMRDIDGYAGTFTVRCAFKLAPLVFLRPIELSRAEWAEIDFDKAEWRIPAGKMKMKAMHIIPLSSQAISILRDLHTLTGTGGFLFPNVRTSTQPMAGNTILAAIRSLGYTPAEMTAHGFRHMASTLLNEQGFNADAIERQLAHKASGVRATYNAAEYLPERQRMMQHWADYLDALKAGADIVPINKGKTVAR
ncbi:MAG: tyrosine-type recombinase/integrase [Candidatus Nitrotoga sp.]|nr:tyrosine-type recombinase/integrase [Candidatus Nitrotoga sp.]MDP1856996.1 tyrosine-type recombinase/integrase [Candidatus Nitrotoga sp.]